MPGQFPLRVSPSGPFEQSGEPSVFAISDFSRFATGIGADTAITEEGIVVATIAEAISNEGAPGDGQLFEVEADLALFFNDTAGVTSTTTVGVSCVLELDDASDVTLILASPARPGPLFTAGHSYQWSSMGRTIPVPAARRVVGATLRMAASALAQNPTANGGTANRLKVSRIR